MFLSDEEIRTLTGRQRAKAQARALDAMGIEYRWRPDGSLVVLRARVEQVLGCAPKDGAPKDGPPVKEPQLRLRNSKE